MRIAGGLRSSCGMRAAAALAFFLAGIARLASVQMITEFPLSPANSAPLSIAAGPDGNLWFTELNNPDRIGRMTPAGVVTEFPIPTIDGHPQKICAGPDGALWF